MKKRLLIVLAVLATMVIAGVMGISICLNTPEPDSKYGITMTVSDVSSTGLKLHMTRENGTSRPYVWEYYKLQKWSPTGWEPIELHQLYTHGMDERVSVTEEFSYTWELDWRDACGRLSTGIYRIAKEVGSATRTQTYYTSFLVVDWWEVLVGTVGAVIVAIVICMMLRNQVGEKIRTFVIIRKKRCLFLVAALLVSSVVGFVLYLKVPAKDEEWGISLRIKESSPTGLTYELKREDEPSEWNLYTMDNISIERWSFWGWKSVSLWCGDTLEKSDVTHNFSKERVVEWEGYHETLSAGLYRAHKAVAVVDYDKEDVYGQLWLRYYAPFVVANWWEIIVFVASILLLGATIYLQLRFEILSRFWKGVLRNKKCGIIAVSAVLSVVAIVWLIFTFFMGKISSTMYQYEVSVDEVTAGVLEGTIQYDGDDKEDTKMFLKTKSFYCLEKRTLGGWKKLKEIPHVSTDPATVPEGDTVNCSYKWSSSYEVLSKGTYRIIQPFEIWSKSEGTTQNGKIYITFTVE